MFAQERQQMIAEIVDREGSARVKDLSEKFSVTEDCIRKDLTLLEKEGRIRKTYGGAVKVRVNVHDFDVSQRKEKNVEAKKIIAEKAYKLIKDGDTIFLDISTANVELAKLLVTGGRRVTVVTNMVEVMLELTKAKDVEVIFLGGTFNRGRDGFIGTMTMKQIEQFRFDLSFTGVVGVDLTGNAVTTYYMEDGLTKTALFGASRKNYMMLETRKFSTEGNFKFAGVGDFTGAIMERELPLEEARDAEKYEIEWI